MARSSIEGSVVRLTIDDGVHVSRSGGLLLDVIERALSTMVSRPQPQSAASRCASASFCGGLWAKTAFAARLPPLTSSRASAGISNARSRGDKDRCALKNLSDASTG